MPETVEAQVIHVVPPAEHEEANMQPGLESLAASRYVLVCREGGAPSWLERLWGVLTRQPITAMTLVADTAVPEGQELRATVEETGMVDVYDVTALERE